MGRIARVVVPGCWHHVTQRGNRRQTIFFGDADRAMYLQLLAEHCRRWRLAIGGYCLMGNHVHLIVRPESEDGLARALGRAHNDYSRWFNVIRNTRGHLWQNRFYSTVLDWSHLWTALRYVELNPVRAKLSAGAAEWQWSSARAHLTGIDPTNLLDFSEWGDHWTPSSWDDALREGIADALLLQRIRDATRTGRPCGSDDFVAALEARLERPLRPATRGPKKKAAVAGGSSNNEVM